MKLSIAISALLLVATADARRLGSKSTKSESEEKKCPKSYSQTHHGKILLTRYTFDETMALSHKTRF